MCREDLSSFRDMTVQIIFGSQLINIVLPAFYAFAMYSNSPREFKFDFSLLFSYFYISSVYVLTYHQFIFAIASIKSRFKLLNKNLMYVGIVQEQQQ